MLTPSQLSTRFEIRTRGIVPSAVPTQILQGNSNRVTILFSPHGLSDAVLANVDSANFQDATFLLSDPRPLILTFDDFGPLIGLPWFVWNSGAANTFTWTEVIYRPNR